MIEQFYHKMFRVFGEMMTSPAFPAVALQFDERVASAVRSGLTAHRKHLPAWLFYDCAGSVLFDRITELEEYYLTRTERAIFAAHAKAIVTQAANGYRLRIAELGAGSADKTRLLLHETVARQGSVTYEPADVSESALEAARQRIESEIASVCVLPRVMDYTDGDSERISFGPCEAGDRRLVLYIGSSIGNFEPDEATRLLGKVRCQLREGDSLLLGVDLRKDETLLLPAYDDAAGVTAAFNLNLLERLNRELGAEFDPCLFRHRARWNPRASRIEMHLESRRRQTVPIAALGCVIEFDAGETIHTENSYKFPAGSAEAMLRQAGFAATATWTDPDGLFAVCLGRAEDPQLLS